MLLSEHVYCVAIPFKMTEQNSALSLNIPPRKLFEDSEGHSYGQTGDWQLHHDNEPTGASHLVQYFGETSNLLIWLVWLSGLDIGLKTKRLPV